MKGEIVYYFFIAFFALSDQSLGTELGYTRSQSSASLSDRFQASYKFDRQNKIGISATLSKDTTESTEDKKSSSFKLSYRHKFLEPLVSLGLEVKRTDESYFYEGLGAAVKVGFRIAQWEWDKDNELETRLNLKFDSQTKDYSKNKSENLIVRTITAGIEQELFPGLSLGFEVSNLTYTSTGTETKNALSSRTVTTSDISSFTSGLTKGSVSAFLEYTFDIITVGLSYSQDTPYFSTGTKSFTSEIFLDYQVIDPLSLNLAYSRGKTEGSTTNSDTTSIGLLFSF